MQHCTSRLQVVFLRGVCKGERFVFVRSRRREAAVAADSTLLIMAREGRERRREREREKIIVLVLRDGVLSCRRWDGKDDFVGGWMGVRSCFLKKAMSLVFQTDILAVVYVVNYIFNVIKKRIEF